MASVNTSVGDGKKESNTVDGKSWRLDISLDKDSHEHQKAAARFMQMIAEDYGITSPSVLKDLYNSRERRKPKGSVQKSDTAGSYDVNVDGKVVTIPISALEDYEDIVIREFGNVNQLWRVSTLDHDIFTNNASIVASKVKEGIQNGTVVPSKGALAPNPTTTGAQSSTSGGLTSNGDGTFTDSRGGTYQAVAGPNGTTSYVPVNYVGDPVAGTAITQNASGATYETNVDLDEAGTPIVDNSAITRTDEKGNEYIYDAYDTSGTEGSDVREQSFNEYWRDVYDYNTTGTTANDSYNRFVGAAQNQALEEARLADISAQQAAMQQAAAVKSITDSLKQERMARLRAGMSESQIASQDMQTMMTNINALNQQQNELAAAQAQARSSYGTAQDSAYQAWLQNANAQATAGSAFAASDAGDANAQAKKYMLNSATYGTPYTTGHTKATGQTTTIK